ncbi:MAG TPA: DUF4404 family protein [Ignavibacteria bacterium]|nr:DUF4404 family protein [Ignavibacteria bacterium]HMQ99102.1 DUF4404 family protein [Ignavibacteria bacterium]
MKDTLQEIKDKLTADGSINEEKKRELLGLLDELESEMGAAGKPEMMKNISSSVKRSADELTKEEKDPDLIESAINELRDSVTEFEVSHPKLFEKVNNISAMLASMGI